MRLKRRTLWTLGIQLLILLITLELLPFAFTPLFYRHAFSPGKIRKEISLPLSASENPAMTTDTAARELFTNLLHPYMGFTAAPVNDYNRYGFLGSDPLISPSDTLVTVCLTGGSVAKGLYVNAGDYLIGRLKQVPQWKDKSFSLVVLALGGYKQPQQLMALSYFLSLGARYDLVINLDGFNEIVLPFTDNLPFHVSPTYPRHWNLYARKSLDLSTQLILAKQAGIREARERSRSFYSKAPWRYSNFLLFVYQAMDRWRQGRIFRLETGLRESLASSETSFQATGPFTPVTDTLLFFSQQADNWARSSVLMDALCKAHAIGYFHFLQPNQYVKGSKVFTKEELQIALEPPPFDYRKAVETGYPYLIDEGAKLRRQGVGFTDLTGMFLHQRETVYSDKCCHFNETGYRQICDRIAEQVILWKNQTKP